jgi:hypothetical protein
MRIGASGPEFIGIARLLLHELLDNAKIGLGNLEASLRQAFFQRQRHESRGKGDLRKSRRMSGLSRERSSTDVPDARRIVEAA